MTNFFAGCPPGILEKMLLSLPRCTKIWFVSAWAIFFSVTADVSSIDHQEEHKFEKKKHGTKLPPFKLCSNSRSQIVDVFFLGGRSWILKRKAFSIHVIQHILIHLARRPGSTLLPRAQKASQYDATQKTVSWMFLVSKKTPAVCLCSSC